MLGSDYRELIVPRLDNQGKKIGILILGVALTLVTLVFSFITAGFFIKLLPFLLGGGTWWLYYNQCIEYEYIISGDELSITKILAQSKRKPMMSVTLNKFTAFGALKDAPSAGSQTLVLACAAQDDSAYYADFDHPELGQTRLIFTPNDDILLYLSKHIPRNIGFRFVPRENTEDS